MSDTVPDGWVQRPVTAFGTLVGPFYGPPGNERACGFPAQAKHGNKRGVVHGGMLATAFDLALGNAAWDAADQKPCATVQLTVQYVGAVQVGEFAAIEAEVVKVTRTLVFLRGTMRVGDRAVATADGVWKMLAWRGAPYVAP